jgi:hypothetical protein
MRKLLYIPAVIFGLNGIASFVIFSISIFGDDYGKTALYLMFSFTGVSASTIMFVMAQGD